MAQLYIVSLSTHTSSISVKGKGLWHDVKSRLQGDPGTTRRPWNRGIKHKTQGDDSIASQDEASATVIILESLTNRRVVIGLVRIQTLTGGLTVNTSIINQQLVYAAEILYYLIQSCLKFSILAFYWRLFNSTYLRYYIYWVTLIVSLWSVTAVCTITETSPVTSLTATSASGHHSCDTMSSNKDIVDHGVWSILSVHQPPGILSRYINPSHHP